MTADAINSGLTVLLNGQDIAALRKLIVVSVLRRHFSNMAKTSAPLPVVDNQVAVDAPSALLTRLPHEKLSNLTSISKGMTGIKDAKPGPFPLVVTAELRGTCDHFDCEGPAVLIPMVSSTGHGDASLKRIHYQDGKYAIGSILAVVQPVDFERISARFLYEYLSAFKDELLVSRMVGTANVSLTVRKLGEVPVPLIPIDSQRQIEEQMYLCDRLEAQQADAEAAHAQLVKALLASLTQARDPADFRASWQQLSEHFHTLFTTESSIDSLKQAVLRLGVMGKLVSQFSGGETARQLLARLTHAGAGGRRTTTPSDEQSVPPYAVPAEWCWTTLPEVGELARGKSKHRPRNDPTLFSGGTIPLVQTGDVARATDVIHTSTGKYNSVGLAQSRLWPAGTMCISIAANIADSAILGFDACFPDSVVGFIPALPELDVRYFEYFLRTAKADLQKFAPSTAQKNINLEILGCLHVPLPPLDEQHRIVAKVDELLALCDQLKLGLADARQHHAHLAAVLVEQAVAT
ncbi:restriction endonuclease subunit S [Roseateles sp. GG27B]